MASQTRQHQFASLLTDVASDLATKGFTGGVNGGGGYGGTLEGVTEARFREVIWELIATGILVPGLNASNSQWPFLSLTEAGTSLVDQEGPTPADPDGYYSTVEDLLPNADGRILIYVREAVGAFNGRLYLGATVMLGTATEGLVLWLAEVMAHSMGEEEGRTWFEQKIQHRLALHRLRAVEEEIRKFSGDLPRALREGFEAHWPSITGLVRMERNEAGHPSGVERSREVVLPSLLLFPVLVKLVVGLAEWLQSDA